MPNPDDEQSPDALIEEQSFREGSKTSESGGARRLLGDAAVYFLGSLANGVLPLALVPVFTRFLTPEDYGLVATAMVLQNIFVVFQGLNAYGLIARTHFDNDHERLARLVSTATLLSAAGSALLLLVCYLPSGDLIGRWSAFPPAWLPAVVVLGFFTVIQTNYQSLLQARKEPWRFVANQTLGNVLNLGLSVWLVVGVGMNWTGRLWGLLVSGAVVSAFCLTGFSRRLGLLKAAFSGGAAADLARFGIPLIPHVLGGWVMTMSARLYLNNMASVADTGLFSLAFNLTAPLTMVIGALHKTYYPWLFERLSKPGSYDPVILCRWLLSAAAALLLGGALFGLGAWAVLPLIVGPKFVDAGPYIFWLSLTAGISGVYFIFGSFVVYSKQTALMAWRADFLGGIVVLVCCPLLITTIGPIGAAVANCLGYAATTLGCFTAARTAHPMPWGEALTGLFSSQRKRN